MSTETKNKKDVLNKEMKTSKEPSLANAPTSKKIGFFSAMMIAFGSCVGAGIFFKYNTVNSNTNGSFVLAMFAWILAAFVVMSMVLALMEIASARNDNLSMIGWCKTFNSRIMYKACKNFMFYIYLPLTYFFMPLYVIMSIQDGIAAIAGSAAINTGADWAIMMAITLVMSLYFIFACGFSSKWGDIQNKIITYIKFIPLVLAVVFGIWGAVANGVDISANFKDAGQATADGLANGAISFATMTPGFGLFMAMGAIFFAYDGFYVAAGLQSEMKEPKKTPLALVLGLGLVTIVYLAIAIATSLGVDFEAFLSNKTEIDPMTGEVIKVWTNGTGTNLSILFGVFNILIGIGVLGIINGFGLWAPRFTEDLIREGELPFSELAAKGMASKWGNRPWIGMLYNVIITVPVVILFCIIGGLGYINAADYGSYYGDASVAKLYSFADLMGTWTAVFAFLFIIAAIFGGITNRRTNRVKTEKSKIFLPFAYISVIIGGLVIFITFLQPFADLFLVFALDSAKVKANTLEGLIEAWHAEHGVAVTTTMPAAVLAQLTIEAGQKYSEIIIARVLLLVVFFLQVGIMLIPAIIEDQLGIKKYGSVEAADKAKMERINAIFGNAGEKTEMSKDKIAVADVHSTTFDQDNIEFKKEKVEVIA
ncbi:MAG: APC family permease [Ureaplasma sp.]|nr:APC family permease [Ureaplasma sp.]